MFVFEISSFSISDVKAYLQRSATDILYSLSPKSVLFIIKNIAHFRNSIAQAIIIQAVYNLSLPVFATVFWVVIDNILAGVSWGYLKSFADRYLRLYIQYFCIYLSIDHEINFIFCRKYIETDESAKEI